MNVPSNGRSPQTTLLELPGDPMKKPASLRRSSERPRKSVGVAEAPRQVDFAPAKARRVFEDIVMQIRRELTNGNLRPGDRLPGERDLARQFGTSRTAVREAFRNLENAGIIVSQPGRDGGAFIKEADPKLLTQLLGDMISLGSISLESLTEVRVLFLNIVVELACQNAKAQDFAAMEAAVDSIEKHSAATSPAQRQVAIGTFYDALTTATRNEVLVILIRSITEIVRSVLLEVAPRPKYETVGTFRKIIMALRARDSDKACKLMREHLKDLHQYLWRARNTKLSGT
jgi:GntR family transcriptional regulator, transcriptional repressor for pyruvate dehydrogenase complex